MKKIWVDELQLSFMNFSIFEKDPSLAHELFLEHNLTPTWPMNFLFLGVAFPFQTQKCSYWRIAVFVTKGYWIHVTSVHEGRKPFKCEVCGWRYCQKGDLTKHITSVHEVIKPCAKFWNNSARNVEMDGFMFQKNMVKRKHGKNIKIWKH